MPLRGDTDEGTDFVGCIERTHNDLTQFLGTIA